MKLFITSCFCGIVHAMKDYAHIVLMGMKHTGKSTVGALLAEKLGRLFRDADTVIAELSGLSPRALYDQGGAALMQKWETEACRELAKTAEALVIATGGGLSDNADAAEILSGRSLMIWLDTPFHLLFSRIAASAERDGRLPKFLEGPNPELLFQELFSRRSGIYATMADVVIHTGARMPPEIVNEIMDYISNE